MRKRILFFLIYWLPVLTVAGIIFKLSAGTVPQASSIYWQDFVLKKLAHVSIYGILAILIYRALIAGGMSRKNAIIWAVILATFYGGTDEFHQHFTQGRESRLRDVGFDSLGSIIAMAFTIKVLPKLPKEVVDIGKKLEIV